MASDTSWRPHNRRRELIDFVRDFVRRVRVLPGIRRVALIGSLCTEKTNPKDADLLVTIDDDLDLTDLAKNARRLQGGAQSIGHGADVFLLSSGGEYLGRICQWRECRPGVRVSCDALHCGRRPYLHDDLRTIDLGRSLPASRLELWPDIQYSAPIPLDVVEILIEPLVADSKQ